LEIHSIRGRSSDRSGSSVVDVDDDVGVVVVVVALVVRGLALGVDASVDITANPGAVVVMRSTSMVVRSVRSGSSVVDVDDDVVVVVVAVVALVVLGLALVASVVQVMASSFTYLERMQLAAFSN
jgi:hypothetical protein